MRDCAKCTKPVDGDICPYCKWQESTARYQNITEESRSVYLSCAHTFDGQRCAKPGVISPLTMNGGKDGHEAGAFYCWEHVPGLHQYDDQRQPPPPGIFASLKAIFTRHRPPNDGSLIE